ncbi:putative cytochrome P450 [Aaosphaeria arxii CBS 175.79]|uniref:Putative cytochrome P450 n=1 Tax=Aaosphaeria arxii CBS 175.79 TaxID=1450172 RepID=A0A6A5X789_9PLEO|nr:putative cytochrome P450 [Aaosphaeria arxii CBS 175.79]KAF2008687.1 putative cytochrome P450 [Aaosphaeria arxii CBS 175.79]
MSFESALHSMQGHPWITLIAALFAYTTLITLYNLTLHPLAKVPGPRLWVLTRIPYIRALVRGTFIHDLERLHRMYGPVLRVSPNEVSFACAEAYNEILQPRPTRYFQKDPIWWDSLAGKEKWVGNLYGAAEHSHARRFLAAGFTPRALKAQEPILQRYANLLIERLGEKIGRRNSVTGAGKHGADIDIVPWMNFTTFDIFGDLSFGESFECLQETQYHPWISMMFAHVKVASVIAATTFYPWMNWALMKCIPKSTRELQRRHHEMIKDKVKRRLNWELERPDIMSYVVGNGSEKKQMGGMSFDQLSTAFSHLAIAGSETTATALNGTINYLVQTPDKLGRLVDEIRGSFTNMDDISLDSLRGLPYLNAVLNEGLRLCPPIPWIPGRLAPAEGASACGYFLPGGTHVSIQSYTLNRDPKYFTNPKSFAPERWLPECKEDPHSLYYNDNLKALHPFAAGPRACLAQNLAWSEMRLVLAKLMWAFDFSAVEDRQVSWEDLRTYLLVEKVPIVVNIKQRGDL